MERLSGEPVKPTLDIEDLSHSFRKPHNEMVLEKVSFQVHPGEFVALIGPSGCGKSTLLRLAAGLLRCQAGKITTDATGGTGSQNSVAWMSQNAALLPWLTVIQNVRLPLRFSRNGRKSGISPEEAVAAVGLSRYAAAYPFTLSGGMQQRVSLARLLVTGSALWLMDEPFAALDELTREKLALDLSSIWSRQQPAVLWVTHNIYEAVRLADRILVMSSRPGKIISDLAIRLPRPRTGNEPAFLETIQLARAHLASFYDFDPEESAGR